MKKALILLGCVVLLAFAVVLAGLAWLVHEERATSHSTYVALGSSFAAGPGVATRAPGSATLCSRSAGNYAQLVARQRGMTLTDVSCSGATTADVLGRSHLFLTAQVDALTADTRLVTVTIGGNDVSYIGNLMAWSCQNRPENLAAFWRLVACTPKPDAAVDAQLQKLPQALRNMAAVVRARAPHAQLVLVDYATVLPDAGACPDRLPLSAAQLERSRFVAQALRDITQAVAQETGATLVDASDITRGHDICSPDPWVFGWTLPSSPLTGFEPVAYHPNAAAMQAIAAAIGQQLR